MGRLHSVLTLSPLKISAGYFTFGVIWIPVTDVVLATGFASHQMPTLPGLVKGWTFIGLSTLLIFTLSRVHRQQMVTAQTRVETVNQQLQVLHRVFRHNIRNDLNVIKGYTDLVSERVTDEQSQTELETVQQTATGIITISEKLGIIEKINPPSSDETATDLIRLVDDEINHIKRSYPAITITRQMPDQAWINGGESLRYAIRETLENAVAHHNTSGSNCEITIAIECDDHDVVLEISDNGPGIPKEELQALRTQSETSLSHTSSVGLWLVTWLCKLHNGSSEFTTGGERGTTVFLRFNAATPVQLIDADSELMDRIDTWKT